MSIRRLDELRRAHTWEFGGKAANLGELTVCGAPVPPGFAIGVSAYAAHAARSGLEEALAPLLADARWSEAEEAAREVIDSVPMDPELVSAVEEALDALSVPAVAVRSSARGEDASEASFAGQYRTLLGVSAREEVLAAIRSCWASLWGVPALEYRNRRPGEVVSQGMGVVVQAMVPAEVSGVLFTVDPVAFRSDRMLVEVVEGLGETLVSGMGGSVVYRVGRDNFRVVDAEGEAAGLDQERLEAVCRVASTVEAHFGGPQDMEFGFVGGELSVFQTRPITTLSPDLVEALAPLPKPTWAERAVLPLAVEHYTTAPKPLDNLVFTRLVGGAAEALRRSGGRVLPRDEEAFRNEIWRQAYRLPRHSLTWRVLLAFREQAKVLKEDSLAWWMEGPEPALREASTAVEVEALSDEDLFARADGILAAWEKVLGKRMYVAAAFRAESTLRALVTLAVGRRDRGQVLAHLTRGLETPVTRSNRALWRLSRQAREDPLVLSHVRARCPEGLRDTLEGRAFLRAFEDFLSSYGHREGGSWYLSAPTWRRDPVQVWSLLASLVEKDVPPEEAERALESFALAREQVERRLRPVPWLLRRFTTLLDGVRAHALFREQSHFDLTRPLSALQDIAAEWGKRLVDRGVLAEVGSVFFLTAQEVREWLLGAPPDPGAVVEILARRRATYQVVNTRWQEERRPPYSGGSGLRGIPASPGVTRGRVRVVRGEHQFHYLRPGEILVSPHTNPSWTPLFTSAAAVVTEVGGPASHAAIVAREYGIPCVMAVPLATEVLRDGEGVEVDGGRGEVHKILEEEAM